MDYYTLYFGLFLGIALFSTVGWRRKAGAEKEETMHLANRDLGFFALTATLAMTEMGLLKSKGHLRCLAKKTLPLQFSGVFDSK